MTDQLARAPHGMAEAERRLLAGEARRARFRQVFHQQREVRRLAAFLQRAFELELTVEVVLDHRLIAAGDEDKMLDAGLARLVDHVLDQRPVHDRQHFLGHGFGGGQEACSKAGDREYGFADASHVECRAFGVQKHAGGVRSSIPISATINAVATLSDHD